VNERGWVKERGTATKRKAVTRVERGGRARSIKVDDLKRQDDPQGAVRERRA